MEITRKYHLADALLLEFTGKVIEFLSEDLPVFTAYDPELNSEKVEKLTTIYKKALTFGTDELEISVVSKLTEDVSAEVKNCISIFKDIRYFARKRFGNNPAVLKQFGLTSFRESLKNRPKFILFMYELASTAEKYRSELLEAGLKESVIENIRLATIILEDTNVTQETGKDNRSLKTEERILLFNSLYNVLSEFSDAAKMVFASKPLKRTMYMIPYKGPGGGNNSKGPKTG